MISYIQYIQSLCKRTIFYSSWLLSLELSVWASRWLDCPATRTENEYVDHFSLQRKSFRTDNIVTSIGHFLVDPRSDTLSFGLCAVQRNRRIHRWLLRSERSELCAVRCCRRI